MRTEKTSAVAPRKEAGPADAARKGLGSGKREGAARAAGNRAESAHMTRKGAQYQRLL
jgi:hypothetical protein